MAIYGNNPSSAKLRPTHSREKLSYGRRPNPASIRPSRSTRVVAIFSAPIKASHDTTRRLSSSRPLIAVYGATAVASPYPSAGARSEAHTVTLASPPIPIQLASIPFDLQQARGAGYLCGCRILSYPSSPLQ